MEDLDVLVLVLLRGFEYLAVVPHEAGLVALETWIDDNFLEGHDNGVEEEVVLRERSGA